MSEGKKVEGLAPQTSQMRGIADDVGGAGVFTAE